MSAAEFSGGFRRRYEDAEDKSEQESKKYTVYGRIAVRNVQAVSLKTDGARQSEIDTSFWRHCFYRSNKQR